jgi:hypothetical protein
MPDFPFPYQPALPPELVYPWSEPAPQPLTPEAQAATAPPELQPGIGVPAAALETAVPPAPQFGPPPEGAPPFQPPPEPAPPPPMPYATPPPKSVAEFPGVSITTEGQPGAPALGPPPVAGPPLSPEEEHYRQTAEQYSGNPLAIPDDAERQRRLNELDPFQLAEANTRDQQARAEMVTRRRKEIADADALAARQHADDWKAANARTQAQMDALLADADKLANTKVDPSGGVHGGRLVAGVIASIIGGLVQGRTGSARNAGLDALTGAIDRGIDAQKADLANKREAINMKRNVLGAEFARHGDMYQAEEAVRLATWKHVDDTLAFEQQNYDPRGRTALLIANQRQQIRGAMQQAAAATRQKFFDNNIKLQDSARQQQLADETLRHNRTSEYVQLRELDERRADREEARDQRRADKSAEHADKESERDRQFAIGGTAHVQVGDDGKPVLGADGKPAVSYDDLRNADGSRWRAASPEETSKLREKKTAATQLTKLYDRVLAIRDRAGGESKWGNSDDYQELKGLEKEILLLKKQGTQGMSSDADMENLAGAAGAEDVTSFRSRAAGLKAARARTVDTLNQSFRDARYSGPQLVFPEPEPAKNTPAEDRTQRLIQKPNESLDDVVKAEIDKRTAARGYPLDIGDPADQALYQEALAAGRKGFDPGASVEQRGNIDALARQAAGAGEDAAAARQVLQQIARGADTSRLRSLAGDALEAIERSKRPAPRGPTSAAVVVPDELKLGVP